MLPIRRALNPAVEWASPCPFAATVSGTGATTALVMGVRASKCFTAQSKATRLISRALGARPSLIAGLCHAKMHDCSNSNLGPDFNDPPGWNLEIVGGVIRGPAHRDEQVILPQRHSGLRRWLERAPRHEKRC